MWLKMTNGLAECGFIEPAGFAFQPSLLGAVFALHRLQSGAVAVKFASHLQGFVLSGDKGLRTAAPPLLNENEFVTPNSNFSQHCRQWSIS